MDTKISSWIPIIIGFIILGGFMGWAVAALTNGNESNGTGIGLPVGLLGGLVYCLLTQRGSSLNDKAGK